VKSAQLSDSDLVHEVFVRVGSGDLAVADLFAEDAVLFYDTVRAEGRDAIRRFYQRTFQHVQPAPTVEALLESLQTDPDRVVGCRFLPVAAESPSPSVVAGSAGCRDALLQFPVRT
jgi:ketosteroid isomerase-like protein